MATVTQQIPDGGFLRRIGLVVFLVAEFEGLLVYDLVRFQSLLPPELDFKTMEGMRVTGKTTYQMGKYFLDHAPKITDPQVAGYYRAGGEALMEIGPKRNAMLHTRPGIDGHDPHKKLRLVRWRIGSDTQSEAHMISDEWLDQLIERLQVLRREVVACRPLAPGERGTRVTDRNTSAEPPTPGLRPPATESAQVPPP